MLSFEHPPPTAARRQKNLLREISLSTSCPTSNSPGDYYVGIEKLLSQIESAARQSVQKVYWSCNDRNSLLGKYIKWWLTPFRPHFHYIIEADAFVETYAMIL